MKLRLTWTTREEREKKNKRKKKLRIKDAFNFERLEGESSIKLRYDAWNKMKKKKKNKDKRCTCPVAQYDFEVYIFLLIFSRLKSNIQSSLKKINNDIIHMNINSNMNGIEISFDGLKNC